MLFGLRNAPATFQRLIDRLRISVDNVKMLAYLDDLIIFSSTFNEHIEDLNKVFQKSRKYNLTVNKEKCRFCCSGIKYLAHLITADGLNMDPVKQRL